jgi:hypothetical protein
MFSWKVVSVFVFVGIHIWKEYNGIDDKIYLRKAEEAYFWNGHDKPKYVM